MAESCSTVLGVRTSSNLGPRPRPILSSNVASCPVCCRTHSMRSRLHEVQESPGATWGASHLTFRRLQLSQALVIFNLFPSRWDSSMKTYSRAYQSQVLRPRQ